MWSPPLRPCQCGHAFHVGRCQRQPFGCPCGEYDEADEVINPGADATYYMGTRSVVDER